MMPLVRMTCSNLPASCFTSLTTPGALYGIAFSHSPRHPHRTVLSSAITGPSNRLLVVDLASNLPSTQSAYTPQSDFQQLAQAPLAFPATKVGWEPRASVVNAGHEDDGGRGELLASSGDVLRLWEMSKDWGDGRGRGYVGDRNGWTNSEATGGYSLKSRSVLTNVRDGRARIYNC
jgi:WD repeat-containing protein 68